MGGEGRGRGGKGMGRGWEGDGKGMGRDGGAIQFLASGRHRLSYATGGLDDNPCRHMHITAVGEGKLSFM